jgi:bacteriocin biosynthesis cyclodehydratase domain-containing protein
MAFRPALRPGAPLLRRDATHLQIGTSPGIVIADRPGLAPLLRLLDGVRDVERLQQLVARDVPELHADVASTLAELRAAGVVVDAAATDAVRRRLIGRRVGFVATSGAADLVSATRAALVSAGLHDVASPDPELLIIVSHGEVGRSVYEQPSMDGLDHLPVVVDEDRVRIGPLVRPGRTPCVTCHDLHRADWDPAWTAIVPQLGSRPPLVRPAALDGITLHAAAVETAAEVVALLDGASLRTAGRCLVVGPRHDERATWPVAFHHRCACDLLTAA